jgi:hypothetical protein
VLLVGETGIQPSQGLFFGQKELGVLTHMMLIEICQLLSGKASAASALLGRFLPWLGLLAAKLAAPFFSASLSLLSR